MTQPTVFDQKTPLPDEKLAARAKTLLGFDSRYQRIASQLRLLLRLDELPKWSKHHHGKDLLLCELVAEQYPLVIFYGDVGTGKTAMAEAISNRMAKDSKTEDAVLFKLSNRVRGTGKVGEMGTLLSDAFQEVSQSAGKNRRAFMLIDEGDSVGANRTQEHSHHEDKVAVNTLIQGIDDLRRFAGRVVVFLCTNRLSVLDPALFRRAAIIEGFHRPTEEERRGLLKMDLAGVGLSDDQIELLVTATGANDQQPPWTFSDIRTRLYPTALSRAFPDSPLSFAHILDTAKSLRPSPILQD